MEANVYYGQTRSASQKFTCGQTTAALAAASVLYVGQSYYFAKWADRLGFKQVEIVNATGLDKSYISQLWNTQKYDKAPSVRTLRLIGEAMEVHYSAFEFDPDSVQGRVYAALLEPKGRRPRR